MNINNPKENPEENMDDMESPIMATRAIDAKLNSISWQKMTYNRNVLTNKGDDYILQEHDKKRNKAKSPGD